MDRGRQWRFLRHKQGVANGIRIAAVGLRGAPSALETRLVNDAGSL